MTIVGLNFTKIEAEKKDTVKGKISVGNNVSIIKVEEKKLALTNDSQKVLAFTFEFTSTYNPDVGSIKFVGDVLFMEDQKKIKEVLFGSLETEAEIVYLMVLIHSIHRLEILPGSYLHFHFH